MIILIENITKSINYKPTT